LQPDAIFLAQNALVAKESHWGAYGIPQM